MILEIRPSPTKLDVRCARHASDAATGKRLFKVDTLPVRDGKHPFTVSGTPVLAGYGGGTAKPELAVDPPYVKPPERAGTADEIKRGDVLYNRYYSRCHVFGRGVLPDLRRMSGATDRLFYDIVLGGIYAPSGMARWDDVLSRPDAQAIHAYVLDEAWKAYSAAQRNVE